MRPFILLALLACPLALAQTQDTASAPTPAPPCEDAEYRQFDFWVGAWDVTANGQPAGTNRIDKVHGGCALAEHWLSASSQFSGSSLNIYDRAGKRWHQTWVDTTGTLLLLDGGLVDGRMVLSGTLPGPAGEPVINRITWTPNADGSVRQHWETSPDSETWTTVFDGLYVRKTVP